MLVLTRKTREQIRIGQDIVITILRIKGNSIRVGVEAPRSTRVMRAELTEFDVPAEQGQLDLDVAHEESEGEQAELGFIAPVEPARPAVLSRGLSERVTARRLTSAVVAPLAAPCPPTGGMQVQASTLVCH